MNEQMSFLVALARGAGEEILKYYKSSSSQEVSIKEDGSPLTMADKASHNYIVKGLQKKYSWPILSEEAPIEYGIRKDWERFWLVDPLDGTKDFLAENDEFTVNIALIEKGTPVVGLIYAPVLNELYYAEKDHGAFRIKAGSHEKLPTKTLSQIVAAKSRFHDSAANDEFLKINDIASCVACGSSLKFARLAEGEMNIYPRFVGSSEWDIAAGHLVLKEAGCEILDLMTKQEPVYNKVSLRNSYFIASSKDLKISDFKLPKDVR